LVIKRHGLAVILAVLLVIFTSSFNTVLAEEETVEQFTYYIKNIKSDGSVENIDEYDNFDDANAVYKSLLEDYDNLVLYENDTVIKMEYGIVEFKTNDRCTVTSDYYSLPRGGDAMINGCYGVDGVYLLASNDASVVYFKVSGDIGKISADQVNLKPLGTIPAVSNYIVKNNELIHRIKTQMNNEYYGFTISIDKAPSYLQEGKTYYSYDGNYFYDDFILMSDDYYNEVYDHAINKDNPYYNYYEYLPHRSYTNYTLEEVEDYYYDFLKINRKITSYDDLNRDNANDEVNASQFYNELDSFFTYQNIFGANAIMMLSLSNNESAYGKSLLAFSANNLFGHAAYDSDPERLASRYNTIENSIYSHAKYYISGRYANPLSKLYNGSFFGNKLSGMNVMYASDPYWGEKAASLYYVFDKDMGFKDYNNYALGIVADNPNIKLYSDEGLNNLFKTIEDKKNMSFIILKDCGNSYKVQYDGTQNEDFTYDPEKSIAYISKDIVTTLLNPEKIHEDSYVTITFNGDGGNVAGKEIIDIKYRQNDDVNMNRFKKDGYEFVGYDEAVGNAIENKTYTAQYRKIESVSLQQGIKTPIEFSDVYNLKGGCIRVCYEGGACKTIDVNSNHVRELDINTAGKQTIKLDYNGVYAEQEVDVSKEMFDLRIQVKEKLDSLLTNYKNSGTYNEEDLKFIKDNLKNVDYNLGFEDIRLIDRMLLNSVRNRVNFVIDKGHDISISGLALATSDNETKLSNLSLKDTYYVTTSGVNYFDNKKIKDTAEAYGFEVVDGLNIAITYNYQNVIPENPIVVQIAIENKEPNKIYSVYSVNNDDDIIKCRTTQTESYIQFITRNTGSFVVLAKDGTNNYNIEDSIENLSHINSDPDNNTIFIESLSLLFLSLYGAIQIIIYKRSLKRKELIWKDYRKLLLKVVSVQEEKQNS